MASPVHLIFPFFWKMPLCKNRISWCRNVRTFRIVADENYFTVPAAGTTFGTHQVILSILFVNVRSFNPDGLFGQINTAIDNDFISSGNNFVVLHVVFPNFDNPVTVVQFLSFIRSVVMNHITFPVIIKEK